LQNNLKASSLQTHGESYVELAKRVNASIYEILNNNDNSNTPIVIILHAGPLRAFLAQLLNVDLKNSFNIKINYGDVFHVRKTKEDLKLMTDINL